MDGYFRNNNAVAKMMKTCEKNPVLVPLCIVHWNQDGLEHVAQNRFSQSRWTQISRQWAGGLNHI